MDTNNLLKKYGIYLALCIIVIAFGLFKTLPIIGEIASKGQEIKAAKESISDLNKNIEIAKKKNIDAMQSEKENKPIFEPMIKSDDPMVSFSNMLDTILELAKQSGLKIKTIEFKELESDPIKQNHSATHNSTLLSTQLVGTYTELQTFLREIYRYQYLIGVQKIEVTPYERDKKILVIDLGLALYSKK